MTIYKVGQVWERDGLRREIVAVNMGGNRFTDSTENLKTYYILWRRPPKGAERPAAWCSTWFDWASRATLVDEGKA